MADVPGEDIYQVSMEEDVEASDDALDLLRSRDLIQSRITMAEEVGRDQVSHILKDLRKLARRLDEDQWKYSKSSEKEEIR